MNDSNLDIDVPKKAAYNTWKSAKPMFSSPQNRRSSTMRTSQKSNNSSASRQSKASSIRGGRGGGIDNSLRGGVTGFVPLAASEKDVPEAISSGNRVQDALGILPILLVDDAVSILKMTKRAIQNECDNISFMEAKNGEEALARVVEAYAGFELIITDIQMPICDGFEFTRRVRKMELDKGLKPKLIIGISANDQQKIADEAKASGMVCSYHDISCLLMPYYNSASNDTTFL